MYVKDFNKISVKRMKEILKEVSKEDMNKWDVVINSKGLFITNNFFINNAEIQEGYYIYLNDEWKSYNPIVKVRLIYTQNGEEVYNHTVLNLSIGQDEFSDFKEYNEEVFKYICKKILKNYWQINYIVIT